MGIRDFMTRVLVGIAADRDRFDMSNKEERTKAFDWIGPQQVYGGFIALQLVIGCKCGEPIQVECTPEVPSKEELADMPEQGAVVKEVDGPMLVKRTLATEGADENSERLVAMNSGWTHKECGKCGRKYVMVWDSEACNVNKHVEFPCGDLEIPDRHTSGLSFSGSVDGNGTVH